MDTHYTVEVILLTDEEKNYIGDFFKYYFTKTVDKQEIYSWEKLSDYLKALFKAYNSRLVKTYFSMDMRDNSIIRYIANHYIENGVKEYVDSIIENSEGFYYIKTDFSLNNILSSLDRKIIVDEFLKQNE